MAADVAGGPVRLVKLIGDAVMLTSNDPKCLLDAALELVAKSEQEGEDFPLLRAGVAYGPRRGARRRLLRAAGQPRQPDHRHGPRGKRRLRPGDARRARG